MDTNEFLTPDAVVFYPSRNKLFLLIFVAAVLVAANFFTWKTGKTTHQAVAVAGGVLFGACLLFAIARLVWRRPALIINSAGFMDNSSALGAYSLRWDEIEAIYISSIRASAFSRQRFLSVRLKRVDEFINRQPAFRAKLMRANIRLVGAPVNISAVTLPVTLEEVVTIMQQKCPAGRTLSLQ